jgi:hypothetical protein
MQIREMATSTDTVVVLVGLLVVWYRYVLYYVLGLVVATAIVLLLL